MTEREKQLDQRLDRIVEKTEANQKVYAMRSAMSDLSSTHLTPETYRYFLRVFSDELDNIATTLSDIFWIASQREPEAVEGDILDTEDCDQK